MTAFGSGTWEYFGETNHASLNDLINTTLGGIALGEMFHRTAWLVRDTQRDRARAPEEGDRGDGDRSGDRGEPVHVGRRLARVRQARRDGAVRHSAAWRRPARSGGASNTQRLRCGRQSVPRDGFAVRRSVRRAAAARRTTRSASGSALAAAVRSARRACGDACSDSRSSGNRFQLNVVQDYDFIRTTRTSSARSPSRSTRRSPAPCRPAPRVRVAGWGGLTALGAVDSLPLDRRAPGETAARRFRGPGRVGGPALLRLRTGRRSSAARATFARDGRALATFVYEGASPLQPRWRSRQPLPAAGCGWTCSRRCADRWASACRASTSIAGRSTRTPRRRSKKFHFPQFRAFLTWSMS